MHPCIAFAALKKCSRLMQKFRPAGFFPLKTAIDRLQIQLSTVRLIVGGRIWRRLACVSVPFPFCRGCAVSSGQNMDYECGWQFHTNDICNLTLIYKYKIPRRRCVRSSALYFYRFYIVRPRSSGFVTSIRSSISWLLIAMHRIFSTIRSAR